MLPHQQATNTTLDFTTNQHNSPQLVQNANILVTPTHHKFHNPEAECGKLEKECLKNVDVQFLLSPTLSFSGFLRPLQITSLELTSNHKTIAHHQKTPEIEAGALSQQYLPQSLFSQKRRAPL